MKILLLGKDGQVGSELQRTLLPLGLVTPLSKKDLNLENVLDLDNLLNSNKPNIIVNAAAYTAVDKAESEPEAAFAINEHAVKLLAQYAKNNQALLVHYSTDYVFDGQKTDAYVEEDNVNPQNIYGASKQAGEQAILQAACNYLIFRTSWVYAPTGKNFINTILQLAGSQKSLNIVGDQFGIPTSAELIADVTALAIAAYRKQTIANGIYHLTASGFTNWHGLACYAVDTAIHKGMILELKSSQINSITTSQYPLPARRPQNSRLCNSSISNTLALNIPDWRIYVDRMIEKII